MKNTHEVIPTPALDILKNDFANHNPEITSRELWEIQLDMTAIQSASRSTQESVFRANDAHMKSLGYRRVMSAMTGDIETCGTTWMNHELGRTVRAVGSLLVNES